MLFHVDADVVLRMNPTNVRGLINKAETQYNLGRFEHALKYFHRANSLRPEYYGVRAGIRKAKEAIENSLSKARGFCFSQMKEVIELIVVYEKMEEEAREMARMKRLGHVEEDMMMSGSDVDDDDEAGDDHDDGGSDSDESVDSLALEEAELREFGAERRTKRLIMEIPPELEGVYEPNADDFAGNLEDELKAKRYSGEMSDLERDEMDRKRRARRLKKADKELLGELHSDQIYLRKLLSNPLINKQSKFGSEYQWRTQRAVQSHANEALAYLDARRDFWQQQKPVYARKNEIKMAKIKRRNSNISSSSVK